MIVTSFVPKHGSYVWYLNEKKLKKVLILKALPRFILRDFLEDHGGLIPQITFKDFAKDLGQPMYFINYCEVGDADKDGFPEFYLTYFGESDGLDAKPLKVIVYTKRGQKTLSKSKLPDGFHIRKKISIAKKETQISIYYPNQ